MAWPHFLDRDAPFTLCAGATPGRTPGTSSSSKWQQGLFTPCLHKLIQQFAKYKNWWFFFFPKAWAECPCHLHGTRLASLSKHPPASLQASGSSQADTSTPFFVEHLMPVRCIKPKLFLSRRVRISLLPKQQSANKVSCIQSNAVSNWSVGFFFSLKVGQNLPTCPNSNQPTKQTGFRVRVQITEVGFFSSKGERVLSPHTSPNSTQSKPNTKTFCSGLPSKNPLAFIWVW